MTTKQLKTDMLRIPISPIEREAVDKLAGTHQQKTTDFVRGVFRRMAVQQGILPDPLTPPAEPGHQVQ